MASRTMGLDIRTEEVSYHGQVDMSLHFNDGRIWLIECKLITHGESKALAQIKSRGYHHRYTQQNPVTLIGMDFDPKLRNLAGFNWEKV